jgi:hypothetical protein
MTFRRRNEFSAPTKRSAYQRSGGMCECYLLARRGIKGFSLDGCGQELSGGNTFYEHVDPDALWGVNDLGNCAVLVKTCWRLKTDTYDLPMIASNNRKRDRARGIKPQDYQPIVGAKRSGIKLPLKPNSKPIDRSTGQPWGSR